MMKFPIDQWSTVGKRIDGSIAFTSKNLRGIGRYASKAPVVRALYWRLSGSLNARLRIIYADGVVAEALFASYAVMLEWVPRRRNWPYGVLEFMGYKEW